MKVVAIYNTKSGADYHRIYLPMRYFPLQDGDSIERITEDDQLKPSQLVDTDIVFYNREQVNDFETLLKLRDKYRFKIVVDIDDYWNLYMRHPSYKDFEKANTADKWMKNMYEADVVTTTNERLAVKCQIINPNVVILPNAIPDGVEQFKYNNYIKEDGTSFIYTGGGSHIHDVRLLEPSFKSIAKDKEFRESRIYYMNKSMDFTFGMSSIATYLNPLPLNKYMQHYYGMDIALAPLIDNTFNSCKSNLKILEAAAMKMPILVSDCDPYLDDEHGGIIRVKGDWYSQMKHLMENPEKVKLLGEDLYYRMKKKYNFTKINQQRYDLFKSLSYERK